MKALRYFYAYLIATALLVLIGMAIASLQQIRLNQRVHECERASGARCVVDVVPVENGHG